MPVYSLQQPPPPPSYEDLFSNIYMTDIPRTVNQSTLPPVDIAHVNRQHSNPNIEACSNPNYQTWPVRSMPQTNPIVPQSNQSLIVSPPSDYLLWSLVSLIFSCMVYK
jgi:hypothetical protein